MKIHCLIVMMLLSLLNLQGVWTDLRSSSFTDEGEVFYRYESQLTTGAEHQLNYYLNGEWYTQNPENSAEITFQGIVPFTNTAALAVSFRIESGEEIYIIPGYTTQQPGSLQEMTLLSEYERDLEIPDHQNIAAERMLLAEENLYFAFTNFGGGFPVSGGTLGPFYSYAITLWTETTGTLQYVYVLLYTINLAPYINPGLFKIDVATDTITQIGSVAHQLDLDSNTLYISCQLEDLLNDPDFAASYSPENPLTVSSLTQKIEDFGATITVMDQGNEHSVYLWNRSLQPYINNLPQIYNITLTEEEDAFSISLEYFDPDGHFPLISEIELDSGNVIPFIPGSNDFSGIVNFSCLFTDTWSTGTIRFSDNASDLVEFPVSNTSSTDTIPTVPLDISIYPNPFAPSLNFHKELTVKLAEAGTAGIEIYNLKGQRIFRKSSVTVENGTVTLPYEEFRDKLTASGLYFLRIILHNDQRSGQKILTERFLYLQ